MKKFNYFIYSSGDMNVVELEILVKIELVCSATSVLTLFNPSYCELLNDDKQVVVLDCGKMAILVHVKC